MPIQRVRDSQAQVRPELPEAPGEEEIFTEQQNLEIDTHVTKIFVHFKERGLIQVSLESLRQEETSSRDLSLVS